MHSPFGEITANLHPFLNPGSIAAIVWPHTGAVNNKFRKFNANTSVEAFSAFFVRSLLKDYVNKYITCNYYNYNLLSFSPKYPKVQQFLSPGIYL